MPMNPTNPTERARTLFLDDANAHGCAETVFIVLKEVFGLPEAQDSAAAMALNGGLAYSSGPCGAVSGAALALGLLGAERIKDHREAKATARRLTAKLMDDFSREFGAADCRALTGVDLRTEAGHREFIDSGMWRDRCMRQIEFVVKRLASLVEPTAWDQVLTTTRR
jgi:C_GCAxxG_C_C family probable redox protein